MNHRGLAFAGLVSLSLAVLSTAACGGGSSSPPADPAEPTPIVQAAVAMQGILGG